MIRYMAALLAWLLITPAQAGVMASSTRVIYQATDREKSLMLVNTNDYPVIVQSWVDDGTGDPDSAHAPFVILPPVLRVAPKGIQSLRILYNQEPLPTDRESVFWLNLYEIPSAIGKVKDERKLALAMNTQQKIFYRPKGISLSLKDAVSRLSFHLKHDGAQWFIECVNPTPLHISFTSITLLNGSSESAVQQQPDMMTAPFSTKNYALKDVSNLTNKGTIRFRYLDDAGEQHSVEGKLSSG